MLGAIAGDIIGSIFEGHPHKSKSFPLFTAHNHYTDDTVLTVAVAEAILYGLPYALTLQSWGRRYPHAGYGGRFQHWLQSPMPRPYSSWGNGAAMRVSPVGWAFADSRTVLEEAKATAMVTHNHPEGIKGAQATALAVFRARTKTSKEALREEIEDRFGYDLSRSLDAIRPRYTFDVSCQGSVPESLIAFLESTDYEDAVRNAVSLGGDADTMACIAGAVAEAAYGGVPEHIACVVRGRLPIALGNVVAQFLRTHSPEAPEIFCD